MANYPPGPPFLHGNPQDAGQAEEHQRTRTFTVPFSPAENQVLLQKTTRYLSFMSP